MEHCSATASGCELMQVTPFLACRATKALHREALGGMLPIDRKLKTE